MSTHNIYFREEIRKILCGYPPLICSSIIFTSCFFHRVQKSQPRPASPSVSGLKQPQRNLRGLSPNRTGLPQPARSSIPKPGSARGTGLPTPRR